MRWKPRKWAHRIKGNLNGLVVYPIRIICSPNQGYSIMINDFTIYTTAVRRWWLWYKPSLLRLQLEHIKCKIKFSRSFQPGDNKPCPRLAMQVWPGNPTVEWSSGISDGAFPPHGQWTIRTNGGWTTFGVELKSEWKESTLYKTEGVLNCPNQKMK